MDKRVYKNVKLFMENKKDGDDLFDRLNTSVLKSTYKDFLNQSDFELANLKLTIGAESVPEWSHGWVDSQSVQVKMPFEFSYKIIASDHMLTL